MEHQYFKDLLSHAFLLIEELAAFTLLNSPFTCVTLSLSLLWLRISCPSDSFRDRKRAASAECSWILTSWDQSVSSADPGTVWANTEQMVWSLSKTNTPLLLVFSVDGGKEALCDIIFLFFFFLVLVGASSYLIPVCHHILPSSFFTWTMSASSIPACTFCFHPFSLFLTDP